MTNDVLFAAATEMEPGLQSLSLRQFNARYPLRVRRWELSERTRMLHPSGPLSKAAAENRAAPVAPVPPRAPLALAVTDNTDGSAASQAQDVAPASKAQADSPQSEARVTASPQQVEAPSLQARITAIPPAEEPLALAEPPAPTVSQTSTSHIETQPSAQEDEPGTSLSVPSEEPATRPSRRRRATRRPAEDARAEVIMVMLRWATAIGQADGIPEVFAALSTVDDYVDHIANVLDIP